MIVNDFFVEDVVPKIGGNVPMRWSCLSLAVAVVMISTAWAQPKLQIVDGPVVNWGTVSSKQSPLKAKVKIVNIGDEELKISKVRAACGCTATLLDKDLLKPGDTATIDVSLNIRGRSGSVTKTVTISSNDPKQPRKVLYLKAVVRDPVTISPRYFAFGSMEVGKEARAQVKVKNNTKEDITLSEFKASNGLQLNVKDPMTLKAGSSVVLLVKVTPTKPGPFTGVVTFKTSHPDFSSFQVMAYGNVKKPEQSKVFEKPSSKK